MIISITLANQMEDGVKNKHKFVQKVAKDCIH
jgi:hypothetical protein